MATRNQSPKARRNALVKDLTVAAATRTQVTDEVASRIFGAALTKIPRVVSEPPDNAYNHSNSTVLRAVAGLVVEGHEDFLGSDTPLGQLWASALDKGHVKVVSETNDQTGDREGDIHVGTSYIVRAAEGGGHHVFRRGSNDRPTSIDDMLDGLLD